MTSTAAHLSARDFEALDLKHGAHNYKPLPVTLCRGQGARLWDTEGREYLDFLAAYCAVGQGHCHPSIIEALERQARTLTMTSRGFLTDQQVLFQEKLTTLLGFDKALLMNSGAEAVETALKYARRWGYQKKGITPDKAKIVVCADNFHGRTITIISFSTSPKARDGFGPYTPGFVTVPYNNVAELGKAMKDAAVCALLVEPIQGEAGCVVPDDGFLAACYNACHRNEALLIVDEIQTGLGRAGTMLAVEHENVKPDMVLLGKSLGGGMIPISAVIGSDDVMLTVAPGEHGSTFGGNPLACAVAAAALDVIVDEGLVENSRVMGEVLRAGLREMRSPLVTEIRGRGLLNAMVVPPWESRGVKKSAADLCVALAANGLLCKSTRNDIVRLSPPLMIDEATIRAGVDIIRRTLDEQAG